MADGVVHAVASIVAHLRPRIDRPDRPLLLEVGDVAEVPDDRAHERAVLLRQLLVVERLDQLEGARTGGSQVRLGGALASRGDRAPAAEPRSSDLEGLVRIGEVGDGLEAEAAGVRGHLVHLELPADLGEDHLARADAEAAAESREGHDRLAREAREDLDPVERLVVVGDVLDRLDVEVGAELAVHAREVVAREGGAHAGAVVVGRLERAHVLHQVDAHQKVIAGGEARRYAIEEVAHLLRVEVADRAAEEDEHDGRQLGEAREGALVGRRRAAQLEAGVQHGESRTAAGEDLAAHVDGHVAGARAAGRPGADQVACLCRATGAQLDQGGCGNEPADGPRVVRQQRGFGPRLVVLRLLADALEQLAPRRIVGIAAVEPPRMVGEAAYHRLREALRGVVERVDLEDEPGVALAAEAGEGVPLRHVPPCLKRSVELGQPRIQPITRRMAAPTSGRERRVFLGNIVCTLPAPSSGQRGTMCTWTWGMVCPVAAPLLMPIVVPAAPSASRTGPASRRVARKSASAAAGSSSSTEATCARGTTRTCPSASGCTSRKATTSGSRATTSAGTSPFTMRQKMQLVIPLRT